MTVNKDKLGYVGFYAPLENIARVDRLSQTGRYIRKSEVLRAALDIGLKELEVSCCEILCRGGVNGSH